jgi:hypothetical protein
MRKNPSPTTLAEALRRWRGRRAPGKYGNVHTWRGRIRFDSKREAQAWDVLQLRWRAGELVFPPLRQVPFHLPGGVRFVVDFLYQTKRDGLVHFLDAKGYRTEKYKLKVRQVEDLYGVLIEEDR